MLQLAPSVDSVDFIQPRHNFAPSPEIEAEGHVYMPTAMLTAMAQLLTAGVDVRFYDENLAPYHGNAPHVGIAVLGAPYIPEVIALQNRIREKCQSTLAPEVQFGIGGQATDHLTDAQFLALFRNDSRKSSAPAEMATWLEINATKIPLPEQTSLISAYEKIPEDMLVRYLAHEFSFYVSQGCKYKCHFCAAPKSRPESYRSIAVLEKDLRYLVEKVENFVQKGSLQERKLSLYLSNLDVFQNHKKLEEFAEMVLRIRNDHPDFTIVMRGLSTVVEFMKVAKKYPAVMQKIVKAGYTTNGFGVDGMTPSVWGKIGKTHNFTRSEKKEWEAWLAQHDAVAKEQIVAGKLCRDAIMEAAACGIKPELLMVFGHPDADTKKSLKLALKFAQDMVREYDVVVRPHIAKDTVPGNDGWKKPANQTVIESIIVHPEAFHNLDFTCEASPLTHPVKKFRTMVNCFYKALSRIKGSTTLPVAPLKLEYSTVGPATNVVISVPDGAIDVMKRKNAKQYDH